MHVVLSALKIKWFIPLISVTKMQNHRQEEAGLMTACLDGKKSRNVHVVLSENQKYQKRSGFRSR